ncbi:HalOD1 output domain-containing protein [Halorubrum sp. DTA98]|uniref:HalOD1 output domain-containing protein n=1 Tax=Halorubrum sp. DTA98 TaxID=3402163 RepID=UPI003AB0F7F2
MTDTTKPPDLEFEPGIDVERDSAKEIRIEANGQEIPSEAYRVVHDWSGDRSLSTTVIHAVQRVLNTPEEELPILYEHIDPDALDRLFAPVQSDRSRTDGRITFSYAGLCVMIEADGTITLFITREEGEK